MENFLIFISENIKILKPRARFRTVSKVGWMVAWMDCIPNFGLARWLFCLEDRVPMGVTGLLSRPWVDHVWGQRSAPFWEIWSHRLPIESVSGHLSVDRGQACLAQKPMWTWELKKNYCFSYKDWSASSASAGTLRPSFVSASRQLVAGTQGVCQHLIRTPYCQGLRIQAEKPARSWNLAHTATARKWGSYVRLKKHLFGHFWRSVTAKAEKIQGFWWPTLAVMQGKPHGESELLALLVF